GARRPRRGVAPRHRLLVPLGAAADQHRDAVAGDHRARPGGRRAQAADGGAHPRALGRGGAGARRRGRRRAAATRVIEWGVARADARSETSAVIPTRGLGGFLAAAARSALESPRVVELILAHDRRPGEAALDAAAFADPRVRVVLSPGPGLS